MNKNPSPAPKQIVILSGKGGTGKTSITAAFSFLVNRSDDKVSAVFADADVDAANLELVLAPELGKQNEYNGTSIAHIDADHCTQCASCYDTCRFDAVKVHAAPGAVYSIDESSCEGCAACVYQCPVHAIEMKQILSGYWYHSKTQFGPLVHAYLLPGRENSGRLVTLVKQQARLIAMDREYPLVIVDGPPGIGCPVISAASGANLSLIVTEPGISGIHDMKRVLDVVDHFHIPSAVCINKYDIYPEGTNKIETFCEQQQIPVVGKIPFDRHITDAMVEGKVIHEIYPDSPASTAIRALWTNLYQIIFPVEGIAR